MNLSDLISANEHLQYIDADSGGQYSYHDLCEHVGDGQKKLAFLYLDNSISSVATLLSFLRSHHAIALLSSNLNTEFKTNLERIYQPWFIVDATRKEIEHYHAGNNQNFTCFVASNPSELQISDELKLLLSTSGTAGSPKFVKLSEENILENANAINSYLPVNKDDVVPAMLPFYYAYGFSVFTTNSLKGGKMICGVKDIVNKEFWKEFETFGFTSLSGVPFFYEMLNRLGFTRKIYPSLKYMTQAGGKMNNNLITTFAGYARQNHIPFYVMYGQTEATARMSYLDPEFIETKTGSIGRPIANGRFFIDADSSELQYKGPNVFGGYAENPEDLKEFSKIELLKTGDVARLDNDGFYYITGRIKRMVKIFGNRVNLDEVEQALKNKFNNSTFACIGIDDKKLLVTTDNPDIAEDDLMAFIHSIFHIHHSFIKYLILESIPTNENGKVSYNTIKEAYGTI